MGFWVWAAVWVASTLLTEALRKRAKNPATRGGIQDFDFPTIDATQSIPSLYGTGKMEAPFTVWYGNLSTREITDEGSPAGYRYYMDSQLVFCTGPDVEFVKLFIDDSERPFTATDRRPFSEYHALRIDMRGVREIKGTPTVDTAFASWYNGSPTQQGSGILANAIGEVNGVPGWRGIAYLHCYAFKAPGFNGGFYVGDSTTAKKIGAVLRRFPKGLGLAAGHERIGNDCNPASAIYDRLTAPQVPYGGAGLSVDDIDVVGLRAIGETLWSEGLGVSFVFQGGSVEQHVDEILTHIDAVKFIEPTTGQIRFKLIREDYNPASLPDFDRDTMRGLTRRHSDVYDMKNAVRITYVDAADNFQQKQITITNDALIEARDGGIDMEEIDFPGISTPANAQKAAVRALRALGASPVPVSGYIDREAAQLRPGDVLKINRPDEGFSNLIVRISKMRIGSVRDSKIYFEGVQDAFAVDMATYGTAPASGWTTPGAPAALPAQAAVEAPRALFGQDLTQTPDSGQAPRQALVLAARGADAPTTYATHLLDLDESYREVGTSSAFSPRGTLIGGLVPADQTILVTSRQGMDALISVTEAEFSAGRNLAMVGAELVAFRTAVNNGDGTYTLGGCVRGCVDTTPGIHTDGTEIWFPSYGYSLAPLIGLQGGQTTRDNLLKIQPGNPAGLTPLASCSPITVAVNAAPRSARPGCPTHVNLNAAPYPSVIHDTLVVYWRHRDTSRAADYASANATIFAQDGTTYALQVYGDSGLIVDERGLVGNTYILSAAIEKALNGGNFSHSLRVVLWAQREGVDSWQQYDWSCTRP